MNGLDDDGFKVKSRKGAKKWNENIRINQANQGTVAEGTRRSNATSIVRRIEEAQCRLESSEFTTTFCQQVRRSLMDDHGGQNRASSIVCYGLGSFVECTVARYQLALLIILRKRLEIERVELYDPMFKEQDLHVLKVLGFSVLTKNEEGKRCVDELTLFYLPHCPHQIVNNLLYSNWQKGRLQNCVIICNSFSSVYESVPQRKLERSLNYIAKSADFIEEIKARNCFEYTDIFNDTSIHKFVISKLMEKPDDFWKRELPVYTDLEFIKAS